MKNQKGSITLFVLIACMFMIVILLIINIAVINKNSNQEKGLEKIAKEYNQNETDLNNAYEKIVDENKYLTKSEIIEMIYPVGSIYITTNDKNPGEYLGGEWESYGEGRTIVGAGTGTDANNVQKVFEINETGGEYQHTLNVSELASHSHISRELLAGYTEWPRRTITKWTFYVKNYLDVRNFKFVNDRIYR